MTLCTTKPTMSRTAAGLYAWIALVTLTFPAARAAPAAGDANAGKLMVQRLGDPGPLIILDGGQPVLQYNYQIVPEPPDVKDRIAPGNRKYAVPRADYIHPLYGLHGEILTDDWPVEHPHHRGIYWAWPEVDWQGQRGDLHALQRVFARPTGKVRTEDGGDFAQIEAENEWRWEDRTLIVREQAVLRAYRRSEFGRAIDLTFRFTALGDDVQIARRGQAHYGGLNLRLAQAGEQRIVTFTDPVGRVPRAAWAYRSGMPPGATSSVGLTILQHCLNPDYPGEWVQYPNLAWIQPTFPASGTRFTISRSRPLELRYRLWIHDKQVGPELARRLWADYNNAKQ
jgi:hypothetical protein